MDVLNLSKFAAEDELPACRRAYDRGLAAAEPDKSLCHALMPIIAAGWIIDGSVHVPDQAQKDAALDVLLRFGLWGPKAVGRAERVVAAAITYKGETYIGPSHPQIGWRMLEAEICPRPFPSGKAQGFVTDGGRFVCREEARHIVVSNGQCPRPMHPRMLHSEDMRAVDPSFGTGVPA
jgi:hypothetical protein